MTEVLPKPPKAKPKEVGIEGIIPPPPAGFGDPEDFQATGVHGQVAAIPPPPVGFGDPEDVTNQAGGQKKKKGKSILKTVAESFTPRGNPLLRPIVGAGEAALTAASGTGAFILGALGGASAAAPKVLERLQTRGVGASPVGPLETAEAELGRIGQIGTYQPKTEWGKTIAGVAFSPLELVNHAVAAVAETVTDNPEKQAGIRLGGSILGSALLMKYGARLAGGKPLSSKEVRSAARDLRGTKNIPEEAWLEIERIFTGEELPAKMRGTTQPEAVAPVSQVRGVQPVEGGVPLRKDLRDFVLGKSAKKPPKEPPPAKTTQPPPPAVKSAAGAAGPKEAMSKDIVEQLYKEVNAQAKRTAWPGEPEGGYPERVMDWISDVLTNDKGSTQKELVEYFMEEGHFSPEVAEYIVSRRGTYQSSPFGVRTERSRMKNPYPVEEPTFQGSPEEIAKYEAGKKKLREKRLAAEGGLSPEPKPLPPPAVKSMTEAVAEVVAPGPKGPSPIAKEVAISSAKPKELLEMTRDDVGSILMEQPGNVGRIRSDVVDKWVPSSHFRKMDIPINSVGTASPITGRSTSAGPIIVDVNVNQVGRLEGRFGVPPDVIVIDGKHRLSEAISRGEKTIGAFVGDKAVPIIEQSIAHFVEKNNSIKRAIADFSSNPNGGTLRSLEILLPKEEVSRIRNAVKSLKMGKPVPADVLKDYPDLVVTPKETTAGNGPKLTIDQLPDDVEYAVTGDKGQIWQSRGTGKTYLADGEGGFFDTSVGIVPPGFKPKRKPRTLSPEEVAIRNQVHRGGSAWDQAYAEAERFGKTMTYEMLDRYDPIYRLEKEIGKTTGKKVPIGESAYAASRRLSAITNARVVGARERLKTILHPARQYEAELWDYLIIRRNIERAEWGYQNPGGVTLETSAKALENMRKSMTPTEMKLIEDTAQRFYEWADAEILVPMVEAKILTPKGYAIIRERNKAWLPYEIVEKLESYIEKYNVDKMEPGQDYFKISQDILYSLEGAPKESSMIHPAQAIMDRLFITRHLVEKNLALLRLSDLAEKSSWTKEILYKLKRGEKPKKGGGMFGVIRDGIVEKWAAPNEIIESLQNFNTQEITILDSVLRGTRSLMTAGTTGYYLPFAIGNIFRDIQMWATTSPIPFSPAAWVGGFFQSVGPAFGFNTKLFRQYMEEGGGFGGLIQRDYTRAGLGKRGTAPGMKSKGLFEGPMGEFRRTVTNPLSLLRALVTTTELTPRLGIMKKAMKMGYTPEEAAFFARSGTVDFNMAGHTVKVFSSWIPFLNARMQAKYATIGTLAGKGKWGVPAAKALTKAAAWVLTPGLITYLYNRAFFPEEHAAISQDIRDKYFVIVTGMKTNPKTKREEVNYVPIPKGDIGTMIFNPIEHMLDFMFAKKKVNIGQEALRLLNELSPTEFERGGKVDLGRAISGLMPPVFKAPVELASGPGGRDLYWGKPIVPERLQSVKPEEQYTEYTPDVFREIGKRLGISPLKVQSVMRNLFGSFGGNPTPGAIMEQIKGRVSRSVVPSLTDDVFRVNNKAEVGYNTARLRAQRFIEKGDIQAAKNELFSWNKEFRDVADEMTKTLGQIPHQSWSRQYTFQKEDWERLYTDTIRAQKTGVRTGLEKRLGVNIR